LQTVSIIVPSYNHGNFLKQRLESIFNQTFQDFEVILLDDASQDISVRILSEYSDHPKVSHLVINKKNSGSPFKQWKKGIKLSKGDYIWIAESDDNCDPNFLNSLIPVLDSDRELGLAYCQSRSINENNEFLDSWENYTVSMDPHKWKEDFKENGQNFVQNYMIIKNVIPNASAVVWRKSMIDVHIFDQTSKYVLHGDRLFWSYLLLKSNVYFCSNILNYFRIHPQTSRSQNQGWVNYEENLDFLLWAKKKGIYIQDISKIQNQLIIISNVLTESNNSYLLIRIIKKLRSLGLMRRYILKSIKSKMKGPINKSIIGLAFRFLNYFKASS